VMGLIRSCGHLPKDESDVHDGSKTSRPPRRRFDDDRDHDWPAGTESRGQFRVGGRFTRSTVRVDAGLIVGMTSRDPKVGLTAGFTWVFKGFTIP